ncbi:MAG: hypothetical protein GF411_03100 [Candidatus Lokiarchaeota archaeon]|nr:hypothetical protein [Candidatus Lokiarchaeota archaeon]
MNKIRIGDLYCGMGGWATGTKLSNHHHYESLKTIWAVDVWDKAIDTYKANHDSVHTYTTDILDLHPSDMEPVDILVGSPPCPEFSNAKQAQERDIEKGMELVNKFFEFVDYIKPRFWAMENVRTFKRYMKYIKLLPEDTQMFIMRGNDYLTPQRRYRCILTNISKIPDKRPTKRTLGDVISTLPVPGKTEPPFFNPIYIDRLGDYYSPKINDSKNLTHHDLYPVKEKHLDKIYRKKMKNPNAGCVPCPDPLDRPARTICAKPSTTGREVIIIKDERLEYPYRYLSLREQACLQGFPVGYILPLQGKTVNQILIGNAFPPPMAASLFEQMKEDMKIDMK